ncbi:class I SAM-dependent methyltransferase [Candidatus Woesearchaeota archaeon]|nr:class I SAM-dependent methyltransferase [Candidatus Woesearchaeota archaeon]MCF7900770.1 class I SAM-dependent methyltransferase [Candidatus Woesearchaeota archaeon]MCF8012935.1 class I SAM-dependent methyltransferase [Candidatus Woesearchaeota archaeon]
MKNSIKKIRQKLKLKLGIYMYNKGYVWISNSVVKLNNGIHPKHEIMKYHDFFINNISDKDKVLDVGCGNGDVAHSISKKAKYVLGIDIEKGRIVEAKKRYKKQNLSYIFGDATKYKFKEKFDVIVLSNVLEHIKERTVFLNKLSTIAPKILIRVPLITRSWLPPYLKSIKKEYRLDPTHFVEYTEDQIEEEIKKAGLKIKGQYVKWGEWYGVCEK